MATTKTNPKKDSKPGQTAEPMSKADLRKAVIKANTKRRNGK